MLWGYFDSASIFIIDKDDETNFLNSFSFSLSLIRFVDCFYWMLLVLSILAGIPASWLLDLLYVLIACRIRATTAGISFVLGIIFQDFLAFSALHLLKQKNSFIYLSSIRHCIMKTGWISNRKLYQVSYTIFNCVSKIMLSTKRANTLLMYFIGVLKSK